MKAIHFFGIILTCIYSISCGGNTHGQNENIDSSLIFKNTHSDTFQTGKIINPVICQSDASQSYALYLPANSNKKEALPVIYFFDAHGDGALPLQKYFKLADKYHFILAGSNNSKNGNDFNDAENIWKSMSDDVQTRVSINTNRIYTCGFSGGAKVATYIALHDPEVKGVIANSAGLPDILNAGNFNFSFTAIAGEGDMNMTDLVSINNSLDNTQTYHRIIFFDGIHEWAPESTMNIAFEGLQLDAMRQKLIPVNDTFINIFIAESKKSITDLIQSNQLLKAEEVCRLSISMLDGVSNDTGWFKDKETSLANNPAFQKQSQLNQNLLAKEESIKAGYQQQFQNGDINYWSKTINDVKLKANAKTPEGAMYQRLQAYLSLAFYSISNQLINRDQNKDAQYFVTLYKMDDPTNSEAWYFSAILDARNHDSKATNDDLLKAVELGFNDKKRLEQQPEFQTTEVPVNFADIESKMK
ncbi:MAG TPA: hypothetical protein VMU83_05345 [Hanamia sp.]|nr:hypothetical protein [Hanamia sp.]